MPINVNKRRQTENNIYAAFWRLYQHEPINKVTVKDITQLAAINRSTFYEYFNDPYDVLDKLEGRLLPPLDNQNHGGISYCLGVYEKNRGYFKVLLGKNGDPTFVYDLQDQLANYIACQLDSTITSSQELYFRLRFVASGLVGVLQRYFADDGGMTQEQVIDLLQGLVLDGLHMQLVGDKIIRK